MPEPVDSPAPGPWLSLLTACLFWLLLGTAAALGALLALAPRGMEYESLRVRFAHNAARIYRLERDAAHLARVAQALEHDPEFVARVASQELQAAPLGGETLPVDKSLAYDARLPGVETTAPPLAAAGNGMPALAIFAFDPGARLRVLLGAALLLLLAFGCCHDGFLAGGPSKTLSQTWARLAGRYSDVASRDPA